MFDSHKRAAASASLFQLLRRHAALVSATAAAVVIVAAASLSGNLQRETGKGLRATVDNNPSSERVLSAVNAETLITPLPNDKPTLVAATPDYLGDPAELIPVSALPPMPRNNGRMTFASNESPARTATRRERQSSRIGVDGKLPFSEIATEFLPLVEAESLASFESGQIVRVELPRQALIALGLPMNAERANEPVKADVLIGEDGLARAIRFVR